MRRIKIALYALVILAMVIIAGILETERIEQLGM